MLYTDEAAEEIQVGTTDGWFEEIKYMVDCVAQRKKPALNTIASTEIIDADRAGGAVGQEREDRESEVTPDGSVSEWPAGLRRFLYSRCPNPAGTHSELILRMRVSKYEHLRCFNKVQRSDIMRMPWQGNVSETDADERLKQVLSDSKALRDLRRCRTWKRCGLRFDDGR